MQDHQRSTSSNATESAPRDTHAPARLSDMSAFAQRLQSDPAIARNFFKAAGILGEDGELAPAYRDRR